jgi:phage tail protein X
MGVDMTATVAVSKTDDMIDYIVWRAYKKQSGYIEAVLDSPSNYRLSNQPELLPAGVRIVLPDMTIVDPPITLWED